MLRFRCFSLATSSPFVAVVLCLSITELVTAAPQLDDDGQYVAPVYSGVSYYDDSSFSESVEQDLSCMSECALPQINWQPPTFRLVLRRLKRVARSSITVPASGCSIRGSVFC